MDSSSSSCRSRSVSSTSMGRSRQGFNGIKAIRQWNDLAKQSGVKVCNCGLDCEYFTSMTDENPGRRFYKCRNHHAGGCGIWEWIDKPMCSVGCQLFPLLREEINDLRNKLLLKEELLQRCENQLRGCNEDIYKLKEDVELSQHEAASCLEEVQKMMKERLELHEKIAKEKRIIKFMLLLGMFTLCLILYVVM